MRRVLLHLFGPFSIYSYGVAIAIGLLLVNFLIQRHPRFKKLKLNDTFANILMVATLSGLVGGKLLYLLTESSEPFSLIELFSFWEGGFSILGTIIGIFGALTCYVRFLGVPVIACLDLLALYTPLLQSISRLGCFFAGCCHGISCTLPWAIKYTDAQSSAPLHIFIHPTQLYSSLLLFIIFLFMNYFLQKKLTKSGQLTAVYLMLISAQRFIVDFWRADRFFYSSLLPFKLSFYQLISLSIFIIASVSFTLLSLHREKSANHATPSESF